MEMVAQAGAHGILHEPSPPHRIRSRFREAPCGHGVDQGIVPENELGAASPFALFPAREPLQAACQEGRFEQLEVMGQGGRVAGFVKLAQHLVVGHDLRRERGGEGEEVTQQDRLRDLAHLQHVAGHHGLDQGIGDVAFPVGLVFRERRRPGIAAVVEPLLQIPAEGVAALGIVPVRAAVQKEPAGEALDQALLHQQGGRAEEQHTDFGHCAAAVPEQLEGFAPPPNLLQLIEDQKHRGAGRRPLRGGPAPGGLDPGRVQGNRAVGRRINGRDLDGLLDLARNGRFAHLPRANQDVNDRRGAGKNVQEGRFKRSFVLHNWFISNRFCEIKIIYSMIE